MSTTEKKNQIGGKKALMPYCKLTACLFSVVGQLQGSHLEEEKAKKKKEKVINMKGVKWDQGSSEFNLNSDKREGKGETSPLPTPPPPPPPPLTPHHRSSAQCDEETVK